MILRSNSEAKHEVSSQPRLERVNLTGLCEEKGWARLTRGWREGWPGRWDGLLQDSEQGGEEGARSEEDPGPGLAGERQHGVDLPRGLGLGGVPANSRPHLTPGRADQDLRPGHPLLRPPHTLEVKQVSAGSVQGNVGGQGLPRTVDIYSSV